MDSLQTIGIQITMNYSVIDNSDMMAYKAHHNHSRLTSPSTGHPENRDQWLAWITQRWTNRTKRGQWPTRARG